ncbi:MAG: dTDP-4-dehydrorhamnose reductase [Sulfuricaulis sp.]|uniref:dTDP-4-dehydrorhamnose reductase n=1 Tax=Sulfuricaulis sp. TaxID=2003553 RepID=UPI003C63F258
MTRILLTGKNGQIGWELQRTLATLGEVIALDRHGLDLADPDSIRRVVREHKPNLIVNAAAYTAVDKVEEESDLAMAINGMAPGILAEEAKRLSASIIHYSTDYVFDGSKNTPYTEEDAPNPLNVYGRTKLAGEQAIHAVGATYLIFRTSWVYGTHGKNFLLTIQRLAKERDELRIVNDQIGAPTWSRMIAEATAQAVAQLSLPQGEGWSETTTGIYHMTAANSTSWHGFASLIVETLKRQGKGNSIRATAVVPIATEAYPLPAKRPKNSRLRTAKFTQQFGLIMPRWDAAVRLCMEELLADGGHCP